MESKKTEKKDLPEVDPNMVTGEDVLLVENIKTQVRAQYSLFKFINFNDTATMDKYQIEAEHARILKLLIASNKLELAIKFIDEKINFYNLCHEYGYKVVKEAASLTELGEETEGIMDRAKERVKEKQERLRKKNPSKGKGFVAKGAKNFYKPKGGKTTEE